MMGKLMNFMILHLHNALSTAPNPDVCMCMHICMWLRVRAGSKMGAAT